MQVEVQGEVQGKGEREMAELKKGILLLGFLSFIFIFILCFPCAKI